MKLSVVVSDMAAIMRTGKEESMIDATERHVKSGDDKVKERSSRDL